MNEILEEIKTMHHGTPGRLANNVGTPENDHNDTKCNHAVDIDGECAMQLHAEMAKEFVIAYSNACAGGACVRHRQ